MNSDVLKLSLHDLYKLSLHELRKFKLHAQIKLRHTYTEFIYFTNAISEFKNNLVIKYILYAVKKKSIILFSYQLLFLGLFFNIKIRTNT
jgi:hypothetical protein